MRKKIDTILIIDDDPIIFFALNKILVEVVDYNHLLRFENGKSALDYIIELLNGGKEIPDLIFLDLNMPIMDGWEFLEEFNKLDIEKRIRINIITSSIDPTDYQRWEVYKDQTTHFLHYRSKPIFNITTDDIDFIEKAS